MALEEEFGSEISDSEVNNFITNFSRNKIY